jgi:hypothetical protein
MWQKQQKSKHSMQMKLCNGLLMKLNSGNERDHFKFMVSDG